MMKTVRQIWKWACRFPRVPINDYSRNINVYLTMVEHNIKSDIMMTKLKGLGIKFVTSVIRVFKFSTEIFHCNQSIFSNNVRVFVLITEPTMAQLQDSSGGFRGASSTLELGGIVQKSLRCMT